MYTPAVHPTLNTPSVSPPLYQDTQTPRSSPGEEAHTTAVLLQNRVHCPAAVCSRRRRLMHAPPARPLSSCSSRPTRLVVRQARAALHKHPSISLVIPRSSRAVHTDPTRPQQRSCCSSGRAIARDATPRTLFTLHTHARTPAHRCSARPLLFQAAWAQTTDPPHGPLGASYGPTPRAHPGQGGGSTPPPQDLLTACHNV